MNFNDKKVLVAGLGKEGSDALTFFKSNYSLRQLSVSDKNLQEPLSQEYPFVNKWHLGENWLSEIQEYEIIIRSPGIPFKLLKNLISSETILTSGTELFLQKNFHKTIGITGTKGKSTTSSLIHHILKSLNINSILGGNIGISPVSLLSKEADLFILELSSFQLEGLSVSPKIALILNLFEEHIDHHGDFTSYKNAKLGIAKYQNADDYVLTPFNNSRIDEQVKNYNGKHIHFSYPSGFSYIENDYLYINIHDSPKRLFHISEIPLKGKGQLNNILAAIDTINALSMSDLISTEIDLTILASIIKDFKPLPHRLQEIKSKKGILFVNDSISTIPESTINALETYKSSVETLIAGGYDRNINYSLLINYLLSGNIKNIILLPPSGARIKKELLLNMEKLPSTIKIIEVTDMREAVKSAYEVTSPKGTCLLSPAAPSFPMFKNFEERGKAFCDEISKLDS